MHVGLLGFMTMLAYLLLAGFLLRTIESKYPDSAAGKALAFIY